MAFKIADFIKETVTSPGSGNFDLNGAVSNYYGFSSFLSNGDTTWYFARLGSQWQAGVGTYVSATDFLNRTTLLGSSTGSEITFGAGQVIITCGLPAEILALMYAAYLSALGAGVHGADLASAATLNLEAATGDLVDVTGTTGITAITLSEGHERTVRFTGALVLTPGASLVLPGGQNITTVAGAFAVFRGYAAGVVRCVVYTPAGGSVGIDPQTLTAAQRAQARSNISAVLKGHLFGLMLSTAGSSSTFGIAAGEAADSTGVDLLVLASAYTKTTSAWALGTAAGALDVGTIENNKWYHEYLIKRPDTGVVDAMISLAPGIAKTFTVTIASPGVITMTDHGLQANAPFVPTTTGALPTGLTAGTQYYVKTVTDVNTITLSATQGGAAINTTGTQSGVHTGTSNPILANANAAYTLFRRIGSMKTNGSAQWAAFSQDGDNFLWSTAAQDVNAAGSTQSTTAILYALSVPLGIKTTALISANTDRAATGGNYIVYISSPDQTDEVPASGVGVAGAASIGIFVSPGINEASVAGEFQKRTNASSQIRARASAAINNFYITTYGWVDTRGRLG